MTNTEPETPPLDESKAASGTLSLRLPQDLIDRIDTRRNGLTAPLSRNQWAAQCFEWVLTYLPTGIAHPERDKVATEAPPEVAGSARLPPAPHQHRWTTLATGEHLCSGCGELRQPARRLR